MERKFIISDACRQSMESLRPELDKGIKQFRQTTINLNIRDINGNPVDEASVRVEQLSSDFNFGCNFLWLGQMGNKNALYEQRLYELFNTVTTTLCLSDMQPEPGVWRFADNSPEIFRRPPSDRCIKFAKKHNLRLKGQPLLAGSWYPKWAEEQNLSEGEIKALYIDYFKRVAERYSNSFDFFDLVNEMFCHVKFPLYKEDVKYVDWAFEAAREIFPKHVKLFLNEATSYVWNNLVEEGENRYYNLIRRMMDNGNAPDAIGFQFHHWGTIKDMINDQGNYSFDRIYHQVEEYSKLGLPMYVSEITIPSCFEGEINEALQAEIIEFCYRMFFSVKNMQGILQWNLCDGKAWSNQGNSKGGIVDEFLRKKPAYHALEHLIKREWRTALNTVTSEDGSLSFPAYSGEYELTIEKESLKRSFHISSENPNQTLILV